MTGNTYGYVRVSTHEQNEDRQLIAMRELPIPDKNLFVEKQSGNLDFCMASAQKGLMAFTPPVQTTYAAIQAMKEYWQEGEQAKWARHTRVFEAIHAGLKKLGFRDMIRREWQAGLVVTVLYPEDPSWNFEKVHDYCYERGFTIYPGKVGTAGTFRLCALGAIDTPDIEAFFQVFRQALDVCGVAVPARYQD